MLLLGLPALAAGGEGSERLEAERPTAWELADAPGEAFAQDLWFVEFSGPPQVRGGTPAAQANERAHANAEARQQGVAFDVQRDFRTLWNGVTVRADTAEIAQIRALRTVTAVYPVALIEQPDTEAITPQLSTALAMTGADAAHAELGLTGDGLSVAIIDTGIDYNHPDLGGDGDATTTLLADPETREMDHPRIGHGWDYVGDDFDASVAGAEPDPNPDPMDPHGHGTHVAGIAGADQEGREEGATGVAPGITFGAYKVFGLAGPTTADVIVEALEDAYVDGMDAVNMSIGASLVWGQEYPTTAVSNELVAQGVVVVNSAGNDAALGAWSLSAPANAHDIISVASADNTFFDAHVFEVEQLEDVIPFSEMSGAELPPTEGESEEVVWLGRACVDTEGDDLLDDPDGKVALIVRGECTFAEKYLAAADAGATGVVIHNDVAGQFAGTIGDDGVDGVWSVGISASDGEALVELIEEDESVVLGFSDDTAVLPNPTGGLISSFSSYGQDIELAFGPTVTAPGGLITSTWPLDLGGYATISGTSMSAPHVAGTVALLLEAEPDLDPFDVRDRLQNTAEPAVWSLNPGSGILDHSFRQGAGMVRIDRAVTAEQRVVPGQIALADADVTTTALTISNEGDRSVRYDVSHTSALDLGVSTYTPDFFLASAPFDAPSSVNIPPGQTRQVQVTIATPETGIPNLQYGGYIVLEPNRADAAPLRVPYSGYDGDYAGDTALLGYWDWPLEDPVWSFVEVEPRLSYIAADGSLQPARSNQRFAPESGDVPVIEAFFGHSPREMRVTAHHLDSGGSFLAFTDEYLPRSPEPGFRWPFAWAGTTDDGEAAPGGRYVLEVELLRAMGDPANEDHWDVWVSPEFRLAEPREPGPRQPGPPGSQ